MSKHEQFVLIHHLIQKELKENPQNQVARDLEARLDECNLGSNLDTQISEFFRLAIATSCQGREL